MISRYKLRTDLAVENKEKFEKDNVEIPGVIIRKRTDEERELTTTWVKIENERAARIMEKPIGVYITMEAPSLAVSDEDYHREIASALAGHLKKLLPSDVDSILVIGLGNSSITPDALGPAVVDHIAVNRHLILEYGTDTNARGHHPMISALAPGVMAQTGMETLEILQGIVAKSKPDAIIAIDALAARDTRRLGCTIQLTDTGINPGAGIGNYRQSLSRETLGIPVIGIGVPTVVDAGTIVYNAISGLLDTLEESETDDFLSELISPSLRSMFVTPKDIDQTVKRLSYTISEGINLAFVPPCQNCT
ncbi:MAG: GPR endopeptidase [Lachnospiraceae bacterium]|nr:GPR endopeptidase [Lachnospiraceae bacterium]